MELRDAETGCFVRLRPVQYQYPSLVGVPYDSDWLIIRGTARSETEQWNFLDASLLVDEAVAIATWLRDVADGRALLMEMEDGALAPSVVNVEPNIGMGLVRYDRGAATIRIFLNLESAPPSLAYPTLDYFIDVSVPGEEIRHAAEDWAAELVRFPSRAPLT